MDERGGQAASGDNDSTLNLVPSVQQENMEFLETPRPQRRARVVYVVRPADSSQGAWPRRRVSDRVARRPSAATISARRQAVAAHLIGDRRIGAPENVRP